jgi:SGNH hydrolase-like domain, acetyltransferase AlgX
LRKSLRDNRALVISSVALLSGLGAAWLLYLLVGHRLLQSIYRNESLEILNRLMPGRDYRTIEEYYAKVDAIMTASTLAVLGVFVVVAFLVRARLLAEAAWSCVSFFVATLALFTFFEMFPAAIHPLHLDPIPYFYLKDRFVPDPVLVYRNRPTLFVSPGQYYGDSYSPLYRVDVQPFAYGNYSLDQEGFTNVDARRPVDVIVVGDSFVEFREHTGDSLGERLAKVSDRTVANLGVGGYGPFQYLELLKRYGLRKTPKFALLCFYEGNDLSDTLGYLRWQKGGKFGFFSEISKPFLLRYLVALEETARYAIKTGSSIIQTALVGDDHWPNDVHPDIAVLRLGNETHKVFLARRADLRPPDQIQSSPEWHALTTILKEFKDVATANGIVPIIVFIPTATHIYAAYSTARSGANWLRLRDAQVKGKANLETSMIQLTRELDLRLIDLVPAFDRAAAEGKLLYYPFDTHWNSEGQQVAADVVAAAIGHARTQALGKP